ncbi:MAG: hypothetical protein RL235_984 [Chlamydiota bacterium]|jgi:hypothetical protein
MVAKRRSVKKKAMKKGARKAAPKRKAARKKVTRKAVRGGGANKKAHWETYHKLQKQLDDAFAKLKKDVHRKASAATIVKDKNHLVLLLGECNYMARQCAKAAKR